MGKSKKFLVSLVIISFLCGLISIYHVHSTITYAESSIYSVEEYTNSDYLLKADGMLSDKNITDFAKEVNSAKANTSFPELAEVIPRQYLESQKENATFAYNGKEYGFYVVKEGN